MYISIPHSRSPSICLYPNHLSMYTYRSHLLAFTKDSFVTRLLGNNPSSFITPHRLHCPNCCTTISRLLRNLRHPPTPLSYGIYHTILVLAISCKHLWPKHFYRSRLVCARLIDDPTNQFRGEGAALVHRREQFDQFSAASLRLVVTKGDAGLL